MPQSMTIGELLVRIAIKSDTREAKQFQQGMQGIQRTAANAARAVEPFAKGLRVLGLALAAIGTASFKVGADVERGFLKLKTQLGATQEEIDSMRPLLEQLARDTGRSLADVVEGYFALRSSGQDASTAFETLTASVKASAIQLGSARDIAHTAGGAVNAYGQESLSGARAVDILALAVKEGNFEASELSGSMGKLLQVGPQLGIEFEQLATIIAKGTSSSIGAREVITQLEQVLSGILRPTETAKRQFDAMGISVRELQRRADEDLIGTLQGLRSELGDDKEAFSRLFESQEAVALLFDLTGPRAEEFRQTLENIQTTTGVVDEGFLLWGKSGFANVEQATNNLKLALTNFYDTVLVPLLHLFGKLPSAIQTVVLGMGAMQIASTIGLGPSLGGLISSLGRVIAALTMKLVHLRWVNRQLRIMRVVLLRRVMPALRGFVRAMGRAALAMLRFATRAIVAGIAGVAAFAASIWTGAVPALAAFAAGVWATTVAMLANPVGLIVLGIVALIAALVLLVKNWDTVKRVVRDFFDRYGNYVLAALAVVAPFIAVPLLIAKNWDQIVGIVGGIWSRVYETVKGWIDAIISFIKEIPGKVKDAVKDIPNMVTDAVKDIPVVGQVLDVAGGVADKAKGLLGGIGKVFTGAEGGVVPGPLGRAVPAIIHGGEMVLPPGASNVLAGCLKGLGLAPTLYHRRRTTTVRCTGLR